MPKYVVEILTYALNKASKSVNNSSILLLGLSYKKNIDDIRESPSLDVLDALISMGAKVSYSDPFIPSYRTDKSGTLLLNSVDLTSDSIEKYDAVLLLTDHDSFNYGMIESSSKLIIDTRGKFEPCSNIFRA